MTLDIRAIGFALFLIAAGVIIYTVSSVKTADHARNPWVLEEQVRRSFRWHFVGRYETEDGCHQAGRARKIATGKHFRCRYDPGG